MTNEDEKLVFEYMGWCNPLCLIKKAGFCITIYKDHYDKCRVHLLDGNDMVAAMNKMWNEGDWLVFKLFADVDYLEEGCRDQDDENFIPWLMQPARFFELMASWLKEKEHEKS